MLGGLKSSGEVGFYSAAHPLAQFISTPLVAMLFIYLPIAAGLFGKGAVAELRRNFPILTKWICSATLPLFLVLFIFPEIVLEFLFGVVYIPASTALRILSLGFIINNFLGPNGATLLAMGKSYFIMAVTLATALLNITLNFILIPTHGIEGAAIASVAAITSINILKCYKLYSLGTIQPLSKNLMKPLFISVALVFLFQYILGMFITVAWWMLPIFLILYYLIYVLSALFSRSFSSEDIAMVHAVEQKTKVNLSRIKAIMQRFL
jgi:O-antigen/teichoic acid export membrane protein